MASPGGFYAVVTLLLCFFTTTGVTARSSPLTAAAGSRHYRHAVALKPTTNHGAVVANGPDMGVVTALSSVHNATRRVYGLVDSTGLQMASLHIFNISPEHKNNTTSITATTFTSTAAGIVGYAAVYMTLPPPNASSGLQQWEVRTATSSDLMSWQYVSTVLANADMPYAYTLPNGLVLLAHEQWMTPGSRAPCRIGFKLYANASALLLGHPPLSSFIAPLTVGAHLEGTPNIFAARLVYHQDDAGGTRTTVSADIGFHFNDARGVDQVALGHLQGLSAVGTFRSKTVLGYEEPEPRWTSSPAADYNALFKRAGCIGNIGQRDAGRLGGAPIVLQEGNIGHMPPTQWDKWRLWFYLPTPNESLLGGNGTITAWKPVTDGGSTAFGNPSFRVLPCPYDGSGSGGGGSSGSSSTLRSSNSSSLRKSNVSGDCVFVSLFIFGQGAAKGEAGVLAFYNPAP